MYDNYLSTLNLSTYISSSIVSKYIKNPFPIDRESPDITTNTVPVLCLKFYSIESESTKNSSYLQFTDEAFKIISEEGGDIIQNFNGQEIIAVWKDNEGEEIQTLSRRATKCAQRIKIHLLAMITAANNNNSGTVSPTSIGGVGGIVGSQSMYSMSGGGGGGGGTVPSPGTLISNNGFQPTSPPINIISSNSTHHSHHHSLSSSYHSSNSFQNQQIYSTSVFTPPSLLSLQMQQHQKDKDQQQQILLHTGPTQKELKEQQIIGPPLNYSGGFNSSNSNSNSSSTGAGGASGAGSSSPYTSTHPQNIILINNNNINIISNNNGSSGSAFVNSPSSPSKYINSGSNTIGNNNNINNNSSQSPLQRSISSSQLVTNPFQPCNFDPLFNIYITYGDLYLGCIGGENNTWLNLIGGDGIIKINKMIRIYEDKYSILSFPVKLSFKRNNNGNSNNINNLNGSSNNLLNVTNNNNSITLNSSSNSINNNNNNSKSVNINNSLKINTKLISSNSPPSSPSPSTSPTINIINNNINNKQDSNNNNNNTSNNNINNNLILNQIFNQIIVSKEVFNLIKSYSICDLLSIPIINNDSSNSINNNNNNIPLNLSTSSIQPIVTHEELFLFKQMKELSKPVSFQVEKTMRELPPELFIQLHNLLWCHLPIHVKSLAQGNSSSNYSMSTSTSSSLMYDRINGNSNGSGVGSGSLLSGTITQPTDTSRSILSQDWGLEPRNVTFIVIHFFSMSFKWETLNFFHPVIVKLQEIIRKSDGTITNIIEKESGTFVIGTMGLPPFPPQNHAINGVKVSMDILKLLQMQNRSFIRDVNIMVITEKIICGMVGCKKRSDYVMIGNNIHYSFQWLNTILNNSISNNNNNNINNQQQQYRNSTEPIVKTPPLGGLLLCDYQTKKSCGKSIIFENINYSIQYKISKLFVNNNNNNNNSNNNNNIINQATLNNLNQLIMDNELSVNSNSNTNDQSIIFYLNQNNEQQQQCTDENNILIFNTFKPLKIAHAATTKDRQQKLLFSMNNNSGKKKPFVTSSDSSQFLDYILLGRSKEVSIIMEKYRLTTENLVSSFTWIQGDTGLGKSSLVTEVYKECVDLGGRVLCGSCSLLEKNKAYSAWTGVFSDLFFSEFSLDETRYESPEEPGQRGYRNLSWSRYSHVQKMPIEQIRRYIFEKFTDQRVEILPLLSLLNPVLRIDFPSNEIVQKIASTPVQLIEKTFELLTYFLMNIAYRSKLVIILEDLQYMDEISWKFLLHVSCNIKPVMIICTSRPIIEIPKELARIKKIFQQQQLLQEEHQKQKQQKEQRTSNSISIFYDYNEFTLQPLPSDVIIELVKRILGAKSVTQHIIDYIVPRSEGNPYVCFEMTKDLKERDYIIGYDEKYTVHPHHLTKPFPPLADSLEGFFLLKFNSLSSSNSSFSIILKSICVIQTMKFPFSLIHLLCPIDKRTFFKEIIQKLLDWGILESVERSQLPNDDPNSFPIPNNLTRQSSISSTGSTSSSYSSISFNSLNIFANNNKDGASSGAISRGDRVGDDSFMGNSPKRSFLIRTAPSTSSKATSSTQKEFLSPNGQKGYGRDEMFSTQPSNSTHAFLNSTLYSSIINNDWDTYYRFKSLLLQEAIYFSLLVNQRQSLHLKLAKWIEDNYTSDDLLNYNELLAHHWSKTDLNQRDHFEKALDYTFKSAEIAFKNSNFIDSIKYFYDFIILFKSLKYKQMGKEFDINNLNNNNNNNNQNENQQKSSSSSKKSNTIKFNILEDINNNIIKVVEDEFQFLNFEEKLKYIKAYRFIGLSYHGLGYLYHSEAYFLQALILLKESPPKNVNGSVVLSLVTQFTKYHLKIGLSSSKKKHQPYREVSETILSNNIISSIEVSKVLSNLSDIYYRSANLVQSLYCAARSIQLLEPHESQASSLILPQLAVSFSQVSLAVVLLPINSTISPSFYKYSSKLVNDLLQGYLENDNTEASNTLSYASIVLSLRELISHSWEKLDNSTQLVNNLSLQYPGKLSNRIKDLYRFLDFTYLIYKGDLLKSKELLLESLKSTSPSSWSSLLSLNHFLSLISIYQNDFTTALQYVRAADLIRPSNESIEHFSMHQALASLVHFKFGNIKKSIDEISKLMELISDKNSCGIKYTFALSLIAKTLLSIYEVEKKRKSLPQSPSNLNIVNTLDNPIESNNELSDDKETIKSNNIEKQDNLEKSINNDKELNNTLSTSSTTTTTTPMISINNNNKTTTSTTTTATKNDDNTPPTTIVSSPSIYNFGAIKLKNSKNFDIDLQQIEVWCKKIIKSFKELEKGSCISVSTYQRLNGIYLLLVHGNNSQHRQKGLNSLYKSAKESKSKEIPLEEVFAWHEIYKFEESVQKKSVASQNAITLYQKLQISPWSLISELPIQVVPIPNQK